MRCDINNPDRYNNSLGLTQLRRINLLQRWVNRLASDAPRAEDNCVIQYIVRYDTDSPDHP
jgi:hypothetical protein